MATTPRAAASRRTGCRLSACECPELLQGASGPASPHPRPAAPSSPPCPAPQRRPAHRTLECPGTSEHKELKAAAASRPEARPRSRCCRPTSPRGLWTAVRGSEKLCCTLSLISLAALTCKLLVALKPGWTFLEHFFSSLIVMQRAPSVPSTSSSGGGRRSLLAQSSVNCPQLLPQGSVRSFQRGLLCSRPHVVFFSVLFFVC